VSLYVKGFGAAAVRELIKAAKKNFADYLIQNLKNYETANFSRYRNQNQR
jgi:hypothetical protein